MRNALILAILSVAATPAFAQPGQSAGSDIERTLADPATVDRLAKSMQALSDAFLNLPVGEVQAAIEGRAATPQEKRLTVRDVGRRDNRNFDRDFQQQIANAKPMIEQSMKALALSLPGMIRSVEGMQQSLDRAIANMPDPTYPKR
jgi:hypothetical protein